MRLVPLIRQSSAWASEKCYNNKQTNICILQSSQSTFHTNNSMIFNAYYLYFTAQEIEAQRG